ncbi:hypothetical protein [Sorangium sp. So ce388]|uniref:hypothetical protein n=1 Tax=Sorangium sp. So ce388 TaxID=3133309 RepID=UPI003F5C6786
MADQETPGATAPDEGERAPDGGGVLRRVLRGVAGLAAGDAGDGAEVPRAPAAPPLEQAPSQPMAPPEPAQEEGPKQAFERWAVEKCGVIFNERSRATGVSKGEPITRTPTGRRVKDSIRNAALINAARARHGIPVGKTMTEADFDKLIDATKSIEVR